MKKRFVAVEGIDGSGKTTLVRALAGEFPDALVVREPGGTPLGEGVRSLLLDPTSPVEPAAEAYLFAAARAQLVATVIGPALCEGRLVICDRFVAASLAYQGVGRGLGIDAVRALNELAVASTMPDLILLLDVAPDVARARLRAGRAGEVDRIERADPGFMEGVRAAYLSFADAEPQRYCVLDAGRLSTGELAARATEAIRS